MSMAHLVQRLDMNGHKFRDQRGCMPLQRAAMDNRNIACFYSQHLVLPPSNLPSWSGTKSWCTFGSKRYSSETAFLHPLTMNLHLMLQVLCSLQGFEAAPRRQQQQQQQPPPSPGPPLNGSSQNVTYTQGSSYNITLLSETDLLKNSRSVVYRHACALPSLVLQCGMTVEF